MFAGEIDILMWLEQCRTPFFNTFMKTVTAFGEETILIVLVAVMYFMFHKENAYRLCFLTVLSLGLNGIIKNLFAIPRPFATGKITCVRPETATGYSFPSGHTQNFATWSTALAQILKKRWMLITALLLSVAIGCSRVYLGAHYPSDVLAGLLLGVLVGVGGSVLYENIRNRQKAYLAVVLTMILFGIYFLMNPNPHFADYFKCIGLMGGLCLSYNLDSRFGRETPLPFWCKLLRTIGAIVLALILKKGLDAIPVPAMSSMQLIWDGLRYLILMTLVFGIYPLCTFKFKR